jgi:hypothetical protein
MKYIKLFEAKQTESKVAKICKKYSIENWSINSEGLVDVDGYVFLSSEGLTKLPLSFGYVSGPFWCNDNRLTSLQGSPRGVGGSFYCNKNQLTSLEGGPKYVGGNFNCHVNQITSLRFAPEEVGTDFWCQENELTSLEFSPKSVNGDFYCHFNRLTTLRFAPEEIGGEVKAFPNPISDIPKKYLNKEYLEYIIKEQPDWRLYDKNGSMRLDRLEEMIEWGIETKKIKPI